MSSNSYVSIHRPLPRSHSLTVSSTEPLTAVRQCPSMSTDHTTRVCPTMVRTHPPPVRRSHSRTVWSLYPDPVRTMLPAAEALMSRTSAVCPSKAARATGALAAKSHSLTTPSSRPRSPCSRLKMFPYHPDLEAVWQCTALSQGSTQGLPQDHVPDSRQPGSPSQRPLSQRHHGPPAAPVAAVSPCPTPPRFGCLQLGTGSNAPP